MATPLTIIDMVASPNFDPISNHDRGEWSLRDVSTGQVFLDPETNTPRCVDHGAMNSVSPPRTIWRCLTCGRSCYSVRD